VVKLKLLLIYPSNLGVESAKSIKGMRWVADSHRSGGKLNRDELGLGADADNDGVWH
jgi:hypothetical protein